MLIKEVGLLLFLFFLFLTSSASFVFAMRNAGVSAEKPIEWDDFTEESCSEEAKTIIDYVKKHLLSVINPMETDFEIEQDIRIFYAEKIPEITSSEYIDRIIKYFCCPSSCYVIALILVDRFLKFNSEFQFNELNFHRIFLAAMIVAVKFITDDFNSNEYYAKVGGISVEELNNLEVCFLFNVKFDLYVSIEFFNETLSRLKELYSVV